MNQSVTKPQSPKTANPKRKKLLGFSLLGLLVLALIAGLVFALINNTQQDSVDTGVASSSLTGDAKTLTVGADGVEITSGGIYQLDTNIDSGCVIVRAAEADVQLILKGVSITNPDGPAIYVEAADNFYLVLEGENTLTATTTTDYNGAIYAEDDILISGDGSLNITSNIDGIVGKDDLQIDGGTFVINAEDDGIVGKDSIKITGGDLTINAGGQGLKTSNDLEKGDAEITGGSIKIVSEGDGIHVIANLLVSGGHITIESGDDGIHADGTITINDGTVDIAKSYEGIEGGTITVNGGDVKIVATDDGFNAAGGSDTSSTKQDNFVSDTSKNLTINGGTVYVNAGGDGLDSNGNIYITGGTTYVDGPTNSGNGAIDYGDAGCEFKITGGTLIAVGSAGMAVNATSATQATVLINLTSTYSGSLSFGDISYTPAKSYASVLISSDKLSLGQSYSLSINGTGVQSVTLNNYVTTSGAAGMQPGMGQGQQGQQGQGRQQMGGGARR